MTRDWKPGDVAVVRIDGDEYRALRQVPGISNAMWTTDRRVPGGGGYDHYDTEGRAEAVRPLVVIDPEDRQQMTRLLDAVSKMGVTPTALRSLLDPPKPDEPTGLGAVVADVGDEYVHFGNGCWIKAVPNAGMHHREWTDMTAAVKVLSPGVTA